MTGGVLGLVASFAVLAVLLLSLNLRSAWHWAIKAAAIGLCGGFFVVAFLAIEALLGWPTEGPLPARFQLHAALVLEPDRSSHSAGAIYLWLSPRAADGETTGPPRAHALPYSRELHEQTARAQAKLHEGRTVNGEAASRPRLGNDSTQVQLFEAPSPILPPKTS